MKRKRAKVIVQQLGAQIPWKTNCVLLDGVKEAEARVFYIRNTIQHGWARSVPVHQIDTQLHKRQGLAPTNFNCYFYQYHPPRPLAEIESDIKTVEQDILKGDQLSWITLAAHSSSTLACSSS